MFWNLRCAVVVYLPAAAVFCLGRLIRHTDCITLSETTNKQTKVEEFGKDVELNYFPPKDTVFFLKQTTLIFLPCSRVRRYIVLKVGKNCLLDQCEREDCIVTSYRVFTTGYPITHITLHVLSSLLLHFLFICLLLNLPASISCFLSVSSLSSVQSSKIYPKYLKHNTIFNIC